MSTYLSYRPPDFIIILKRILTKTRNLKLYIEKHVSVWDSIKVCWVGHIQHSSGGAN